MRLPCLPARVSRLLPLVLLCALVVPGVAAAPEPALPANVERLDSLGGLTQYRLRSNGMTILLREDHAAPVFTFMVVYHVGSRNEAPGNTGSAHLLEHMIFNKSTQNFGRANGHPTFQEVLYQAGADYASTNMTTWNDRMNGYSTLPSDQLELAMKIEADRLGRGLILDSERQSEMSVVRNEYEIGENDPSSALGKAVVGAAIVAHPYHWDTIGYRSDIEGVSTDTLREHYRNFFHPDNAAAILVGDFEPGAALALFDREFGGFARASRPVPRVITEEPPQEGERRVVVKRPGTLGIVQLAWMRPGALHPDFMAFEVLSTLLSEGVSSRLHQALVERSLASEVHAYNFTFRDPYPLVVEATLADGATHQQAEDAIEAVVADVASRGVSEAELARAKEQIDVLVARGRDGTYAYTANLGEAVASADWKWFVRYPEAIRKVTADDVRRAAATYLLPDRVTVGWFVPVEAKVPAPPLTAAAPDAPAAAAAMPVSAQPAAQPAPQAVPPPAAKPTTPAVAPQVASRPGFAARTLRKVLPNGIVVDVVENHAVPTVALRGLLLAGRAHAPAAQPAVPELLAMMVQRGTATRSKEQIAGLLDGAGATLSVATTPFEANVTGAARAKDTTLLLELLADMLQRPSFPEDELAKAKAELRNAIRRDAQSTSLRAVERLTQLAYPEGHPYRAPGQAALEKSLDAASVADLRAFHRARYVGATLTLAIVGDVDARKTLAQVEKLFAGLPRGARPAADAARVAPGGAPGAAPARELVSLPGKANVNLVLGQASGLRRGDPDYEAALIANAALGQTALSSRIGKRVRDTEGLSYSLNSRFDMSDLLDGVWRVNVNVAPPNLARALRSTREEIERYAREGATPEEVEVQKSYFAGYYRVGLGSNAGVAAALVTAEKFGYGPRYLDEFPERMRRVTREQVNAALRARLHPDRLHLVVAGDVPALPE